MGKKLGSVGQRREIERGFHMSKMRNASGWSRTYWRRMSFNRYLPVTRSGYIHTGYAAQMVKMSFGLERRKAKRFTRPK